MRECIGTSRCRGGFGVAQSPSPCFPQLGLPLCISFMPTLASFAVVVVLGFTLDYHYVQKEKEHHLWYLVSKSRHPFSQKPLLHPSLSHISVVFTESHGSIPMAKGVPCADWCGPVFLNQSLAWGMGLQSDAPKKYKGSERRGKGNGSWVGIYYTHYIGKCVCVLHKMER